MKIARAPDVVWFAAIFSQGGAARPLAKVTPGNKSNYLAFSTAFHVIPAKAGDLSCPELCSWDDGVQNRFAQLDLLCLTQC